MQAEILPEKLMSDTMKSLNFGYELMKYVNINRLTLDNQLCSDYSLSKCEMSSLLESQQPLLM